MLLLRKIYYIHVKVSQFSLTEILEKTTNANE